MTRPILLPANATPAERAVVVGLQQPDSVYDAVDSTAGLRFNRPIVAGFGEALVASYGLGPIRQFFNTPEQAIDAGIPWQRVRGTLAAVTTAMAWVSYTIPASAMEHHNPRRRKWNRWQAAMGRLPTGTGGTALLDAERLANLSGPARAVFWRGFHGYDIRAAETSWRRTSAGLAGDSSGVRMGGVAKWSHGRSTALTGALSGAERTALGIDYVNGQALTWSASITWDAPGVTWVGVTDAAALKAWLLARRTAWLRFSNSDGQVIGAARVTRSVLSPGVIRFVARTPFNVASGQTATSVALVFDPVLVDAFRPGRLWLGASDFSGGVVVSATAVSIPFAATIRERVQFDLTV